MASALIEEYIESIYHMAQDGVPVIGARLMEKFGVSAPTVTTTVKRMVRDGHIEVSERKEISLTPSGQQLAESMLRRHRLSERLLTDFLGFEWHRVHAEACRIEHSLSPEVEARLSQALGHPPTCPHGNPIPGNAGPAKKNTIPLIQAKIGEKVRVARISEVAEEDDELMAYLHEQGLMPGSSLTVLEKAPFNGPVSIRGDNRVVAISPEVAAKVWVLTGADAEAEPQFDPQA
ncbi:MAG: metal-dependent transcriptional regulator [Dehalococcoidia bacterium]|nr:metal-dependent transcriptional regulator [Dehalococcoidia bacterium]